MEDISLHILDIAENSVNAGASAISIRIIEKKDEDLFSVEIEDNGRGIPEELKDKVLDPFYTTRTTRRVGLGLSLLKQAAEATGGKLALRSEPGKGTTVTAIFRPGHIDMEPVGSIADTITVLIAGSPDIDIVFSWDKNGRIFSFDTKELRAGLEGVPLNSPDVLVEVRKFISESLAEIEKPAERGGRY